MTERSATVSAELAALGPFFAVESHDEDSAPGEPWRGMAELVNDPAVLAARVGGVRDFLAAAGGQPAEAVELRVAASVTHLGLVARVLSPALAVAVHGGWPVIDLATVRWQPQLGGSFPLSLPRSALDGSGAGAGSARALLDGPVRELTGAVGRLSVSPRVLWGNVASAVNGAVTVIAGIRPAQAERARALAAQLLAEPPLRGTSTTPPFRRRSCCLIYRAAPKAAGPYCGDCVLSR